MKTSQEKIDRAIKLRTEQRLSLGEIKAITGISRSVLHRNLRNYPLSKEESKQRWKKQVVNKFQKTTDLSGKRFGRLLVLNRFYGDKKYKESQWCCLCDCGKNHIAVKSVLKNGNTKSCGCLAQECRINLNCKNPDDVNFNYIFCSYRKSAQKRKLDFYLSKDLFLKLIKGDCYYCDSKPYSKIMHHKNNKVIGRTEPYFYNGIDRVNNDIGYIESNCVSCCKFCNYAKRAYSVNEFQQWIQSVKRVAVENFILKERDENVENVSKCNSKSETNNSNPTNSGS